MHSSPALLSSAESSVNAPRASYVKIVPLNRVLKEDRGQRRWEEPLMVKEVRTSNGANGQAQMQVGICYAKILGEQDRRESD